MVTWLLLLPLMLLMPLTVEAATYWVSQQSGHDRNACQASTTPLSTRAKQTIGGGLPCLRPGDTLYVRAGTYAEAHAYDIPSGTSETARVTISAAPGESVTWQGTPGCAACRPIEFWQQEYITINGFKFDGQRFTINLIKSYVVAGDNPRANHIRLSNNEIFSSRDSAILGDGDYFEFLKNHIYDWGHQDEAYGPGYGGFYWQGNYSLIDGNYLHDGFGGAIGNWRSEAGKGPNGGGIIRNNIIARARYTRPGVGTGEGGGIFVAHQYESTFHTQIYNNVIYDSDNCIGVGFSTHPASDVWIYNNICVNNGHWNSGGYGIKLYNAPNARVRNNIIVNTGGEGDFAVDLAPSYQASHNLCSSSARRLCNPGGNPH